MKNRAYILLLIFFWMGCNEDAENSRSEIVHDTVSELDSTKAEEKIDSTFSPDKWRVKKGPDYPFRDGMVQDLMNREEVRALNKEEIVELLGEPDRVDRNHLFYRINEKRLGWLTLHTKTMVVKLYPDSIVNWIKIHE